MPQRRGSETWDRGRTTERGSPGLAGGLAIAAVFAVVVAGVVGGGGSFLADRFGWIGGDTDEQEIEAQEIVEETSAGEEQETTRPRVRRKRKPKRPKPVKKPPPPKPKAKPVPQKPSIEMPNPGDIRTARLPEGLTVGDISDTLAAKGGDMRRCLEKSAKAGEKIKGTVYVHMTIDQWGKVSEAHIKDREIDRSVLGRCMLGRIGGGGYPPAGNSPVTVTFPVRIIRPN